jgi:hypothetical protein
MHIAVNRTEAIDEWNRLQKELGMFDYHKA